MHDTIWLDAPGEWGTPEAVRAMHRISVPTVRQATRVFAVSHSAADDLVRGLGLDARHIDVVPHGVRVPDSATVRTPEPELRARLGLGDGPLILCVAQKRPYKNQEALIRALARLPRPGLRLVLVGAPTEYEEQLRALALKCGVSQRVVFLDWVDAGDLEGLYSAARCMALPSRREGFGLPVLEAMARGCAVACSAIEVLHEVAGDDAVFFDPADVAAIAVALAQLLDDDGLRADLARRGRERAARCSWAGTAEKTVAGYRRAVNDG
jgi:glycosyltransferase involved in cell wall biosynthesis